MPISKPPSDSLAGIFGASSSQTRSTPAGAVIDKKRDPSPAGKYVRPDGRQAGRRKICREPDEVIRVKVIDQPLVSDEMFQRAKAILAAKARGHYRNREGYTPAWQLYVYKGFLFCDLCESPYYTCSTKQDGVSFDYYKCRNRMPQSRIPIDQRCRGTPA